MYGAVQHTQRDLGLARNAFEDKDLSLSKAAHGSAAVQAVEGKYSTIGISSS